MKRRILLVVVFVLLPSALAFVPLLGLRSWAFHHNEISGTTAGPVSRSLAAKIKIQPVAVPRPVRPLAEARKKMAETIDIDNPMVGSLKDVLKNLAEKYGFPTMSVDLGAFKEENPEAANIYDTAVSLSAPKRITRSKILKMVLGHVEPRNATFLVLPTYVDITTQEHSAPQRQPIMATFAGKPLAEALDDLADMTGISILVDARAGDKARTPITARFQQETSLVTAVAVLADMADLKLMVVNNLLYVTSPSNKVVFPVVGFQIMKKVE